MGCPKTFFQVFSSDRNSQARIGQINTSHGQILTPAFVPVGSQATVKSLSPADLREIGTQVFFANTYHLYLKPGEKVIEKLGGLHRFASWSRPLMSDSGGFQVFSLGRGDLVKIDYQGVTFRSHLDGSKHYFTPEKSIEIQMKLGADIMIAFDQCSPYPASFDYVRSAMERTHRWAQQSLAAAQKRKDQFLFGVIQGGIKESLRKKSAQFIASLPFDGLAIGGVAVGEKKSEMVKVLNWVMPLLLKEKKQRPIHLLGVGEIDDIFEAVGRGVDSLDCVMPTRLGRMGWLLIENRQKDFKYDINKVQFAQDSSPVGDDCQCPVCQNFSKAYLHHLFRSHELLAYRLATYHNLFFLEQLFAKIRESIKKGEFLKLKEKWLKA
jgi:queuine tRNA-ribosyltransferase